MQVLFESIYQKFTDSTGAGSLYADLGGRMHFTEAPQGQTYPYGVYFEISDVPSWTFDSDMESYLIQFNLFDNSTSGSAKINTASKALTDLYDWTDLSTSGYSHVYMKREFSNLIRESESKVWNFMVQYRIENQKD